MVRGTLDTTGVGGRAKGRSKYGTKKGGAVAPLPGAAGVTDEDQAKPAAKAEEKSKEE